MSPASRVRTCLALMGFLLAFPGLLLSQTIVPQGGEHTMSGPAPGNQMQPAITFGSAGGLVVCDDNAADPSGLGISARRLDAALSPVGGLFRVNETIFGNQQHPRVSSLNNGGAVVVWEGEKPGPKKGAPEQRNVYARFLDSNGAFTTGELLVNPAGYTVDHRVTTNWTLIRNNKPRPRTQRIRETIKDHQEFNVNPGVATLSDGSVVVVYSSSRKLSVKTFGLSEQLRWDFRRSLFITNRTRVPISLAFNYMSDVYAQRFDATGAKSGAEFVVNGTRDFNQRHASVAALSGGGFVVCWINEVPTGEGRVTVDDGTRRQGGGRIDVFARVFGSDGVPAGQEFRVSDSTWASGAPVVAGRSNGGFTIAWAQRDAARENGLDIWFRAFDSSANPVGDPHRSNMRLYGDQFAPVIASVGTRQLLVWSSMGQDGSWEGVYGRLLNGEATVGDEFLVNTTKYLRQINPAVAGNGTAAIVVWSGYGFDAGFDLFAQRYHVP